MDPARASPVAATVTRASALDLVQVSLAAAMEILASAVGLAPLPLVAATVTLVSVADPVPALERSDTSTFIFQYIIIILPSPSSSFPHLFLECTGTWEMGTSVLDCQRTLLSSSLLNLYTVSFQFAVISASKNVYLVNRILSLSELCLNAGRNGHFVMATAGP